VRRAVRVRRPLGEPDEGVGGREAAGRGSTSVLTYGEHPGMKLNQLTQELFYGRSA
jgi:hypothetical protein